MNDQPKLTIYNRDGSTTEVTPIKMWSPCGRDHGKQDGRVEEGETSYTEDECSMCLGTGEDDFDEMGRCKICHGKGVIRTYIEEEEDNE